MTPGQAKDLLPIIKAFSEGKTIQVQSELSSDVWHDLDDPSFASKMPYRIKPDPVVVKYRRFIWRQGSSDTYCVATAFFDAHNTSVKRIEGTSSFVRWIDTDWITENV